MVNIKHWKSSHISPHQQQAEKTRARPVATIYASLEIGSENKTQHQPQATALHVAGTQKAGFWTTAITPTPFEATCVIHATLGSVSLTMTQHS